MNMDFERAVCKNKDSEMLKQKVLHKKSVQIYPTGEALTHLALLKKFSGSWGHRSRPTGEIKGE
jgi:hypothetical protein